MPKTGRTASLTRDEIIDAALSLIQKQGLSGLTMRAVAAELQVTPMAVYYYIDDKDELLRLAVERITASRNSLRMDADGWRASLKRHLLSAWENSTSYPGLGAYLINLPTLGVTPENLDIGLAFFEEAGFSPTGARLAWSFAMTYIHGRISVDAHFADHPEGPRLDGLHARDYVIFGIDALIDGLAAMLEAEPRPAKAAAAATKGRSRRQRPSN
jgi:TetR/AcrR family transcriptional regulator, tetracycline repressor protein